MLLVKQSTYKDVKVKCLFPDLISGQEQPHRGPDTYFNLRNLVWEALLSPHFPDEETEAQGRKKNHFPQITESRAKGLEIQSLLWPVRYP